MPVKKKNIDIKFPFEVVNPVTDDEDSPNFFLFGPKSQNLDRDNTIGIRLFKKFVYPRFYKKYHIDLSKIGEYLGGGSYGSAWEYMGNKVIKFTSDRSEVANASRIAGKDLPNVIHFERVFVWPERIRIKDKGREIKFYLTSEIGMIVQEKIIPIDESDWVSDDDIGSNYGELASDYMSSRITLKTLKQTVKYEAREAGWDVSRGFEPFPGFFRGLAALKKNKIYFHDIHNGNIGMRQNGEYVFFDLGFSQSSDTSKATSVQLDHLMKTIILKNK